MVEGRDAGCSDSQQYLSLRDRWSWKICELQPSVAAECFRPHCTHVSSPENRTCPPSPSFCPVHRAAASAQGWVLPRSWDRGASLSSDRGRIVPYGLGGRQDSAKFRFPCLHSLRTFAFSFLGCPL